jgi:hypothetical protein
MTRALIASTFLCAAMLPHAAKAQTALLVCNARTDNTAAIQNLIDTYNAAELYTTGGMHSECITKKIIIRDNTHVDCHGLTLKLANNTNDDMFITDGFLTLTGTNSPGGVSQYSIRQCKMDGNRANNTAGYGIRSYGWKFVWRDLIIYDFANDNFYSEWSDAAETADGGGMEAQVDNVSSSYANGWGGTWAGPHDSTINGLITYHNNQGRGRAGGFRTIGHGQIASLTSSHSWGTSQYRAFDFEAPITNGNGIYGEGASGDAQIYLGAEVIASGIIVSHCSNGSDGILFGPGVGAFLVGGACSVNFGLSAAPSTIFMDVPVIRGKPPNCDPITPGLPLICGVPRR